MEGGSFKVRSAVVKTYQIADRTLCVETDQSWIADSFDRYLTRLRAVPLDQDAHPNPDAILAIHSSVKPEIPGQLEKFKLTEGVDCYCGHTSFWVSVHNSIIVGDESKTVAVWLDPELRHAPELSVVFAYGFTTAMRRAKAFELHTAAVVKPETDAGVLLIGGSGSGKSTLAVHLSSQGWKYSTDDVAMLFEDERGVLAYGLRHVFALTTETILRSGLSSLESLIGDADDAVKRSFQPEKLFPGGYVPTCRPAALFFCSRTGADSSFVKELQPAEAMQRFINFCIWCCLDNPVGAQHLRVLERLVRQSRSFALYAGNDLLADPAYTASFIGSFIES